MNTLSTHIGIYGIYINNGELLCIKKNTGPYKNRYDLPGGSQKDYEGLTETLLREYEEETGYEISEYHNPKAYDVFVTEETGHTTHHIMIFYDIEIKTSKKNILEYLNDGEINDSKGVCWMKLNCLNENNSSPVILKLKQEINKEKNFLDKVKYNNWKIL